MTQLSHTEYRNRGLWRTVSQVNTYEDLDLSVGCGGGYLRQLDRKVDALYNGAYEATGAMYYTHTATQTYPQFIVLREKNKNTKRFMHNALQ